MDDIERRVLRRIAATDFETPFVAVDREVEAMNIAHVAEKARAAGLALRPHAKTHKSPELARLQLAEGAVGLTVAKVAEALVFLKAGFDDLLVAHPLIDRRKIERVLTAAPGARVILMADSPEGLAAIGETAKRLGLRVGVRVKVDVGQHRCGVEPLGDAGIDLARRIADHPALAFAGFMSHAGHAYAAPDPDAARTVARIERELIVDLAARTRAAGLPVPVVSVGSTPTVLLDGGFEGIDEIRPGNYVFNDLTQFALGAAPRSRLALSVVATVVSRNADFAIVDAGSKVLSSDRGPHGSTRVSGNGLAFRLDEPDGPEMPVVGLSEEHGLVAHGGHPPEIGERLRILPNHACPVVNLAREIVVLEVDGRATRRPVAAAGATS